MTESELRTMNTNNFISYNPVFVSGGYTGDYVDKFGTNISEKGIKY